MQTIWKYELQIIDVQTISLALDAVILSVGYQRNHAEQRDMLCLWAQVAPNMLRRPRTIEIHGTGNRSIDPATPRTFIGTVPMPNGLVWHVFERLP